MIPLSRERTAHMKHLSRRFLVGKSQQHQEILTHMGLENFCAEPYFSNLRHNMRELVEVLAAVAAGVPRQHYGFYRLEISNVFTHLHAVLTVNRVVSVDAGNNRQPRRLLVMRTCPKRWFTTASSRPGCSPTGQVCLALLIET